MKFGIGWDFVSAVAHNTGLVVNPRCPAILNDGRPCDRLATIRVTDQHGKRSTFYCSVHLWPRTIHDLDSPRWQDYYRDWDHYWATFPDALNRDLIRSFPA